MTLDRGFKAWAERTAAALRSELALEPSEPLLPVRLAAHFGVTLWTCDEVPGMPDDILRQLTVTDPWGWSAVTLNLGQRIIVIYNNRRTPGRQASDITHELAHLILNHDPATVVLSESVDVVMRSFDQKQEDEANCLAWALLLPRDALFSARRRRMNAANIADHFGVTETLVQFRLRTTGIDLQLRRSARE